MFKRLKNKEKILILGLGGVGYYLAKRLQHEEYAVTAIQPDPERYRYGDETLDVRLIRGEAMDIDCWREADAASMACVICVTDNDAVNMMSAQIADKFGIPYKIVRVHSLQFGLPGSLLGGDDLKIDLLIHPEEMVAQEITRVIKLRHGNEVIESADQKIQLLAARITHDSQFADQKLKDISLKYSTFAFRVVAVARGITTIIPDGEFEILPHDQIVVMTDSEHLPEMMKIAGVPQGLRQRVLIVGGGRIGCRVAELLKKSVEITLIERDGERARELAGLLTHVQVLHGDGSKADVLNLAGVQDIDTFITTTGSNETNIMSSLLAKNMMSGGNNNGNGNGTEKTIAVVSKEDYQVLAATIGLDIALNKKVMAAGEIMKHIRRSELISAAHLHGFDAEVVELVAAPGSPITKKPLAKLDPSYQGKLLIGGVYRDGVWQVAVGSTHIAAHERVIGVCLSMQLKEMRKLFSV